MPFDFEVAIIGSGFGATVVATELARKAKFKPDANGPKILMLERGVWWFTPERGFPDTFKPNVDTTYPPGTPEKQPVQYWPRPDHRRGVLELLYATWANLPGGDRRNDPGSHPQPLYRFWSFDELDVVGASGVGGGSLVYSNVTIEPTKDPDSKEYPVMENWDTKLKETDYDDARDWMDVNRGKPSNVITKFPPNGSASLPVDTIKAGEEYAYLGKVRWLKEASDKLKTDAAWKNKMEKWAPLDLAIIEYPDPNTKAEKRTFCERQGRCFLGCLPGARHTLNKTLIDKVVYPAAAQPKVEMRSLAEVTNIVKLDAGGYEVQYEDLHYGDGIFDDPTKRHRKVTARVVVLAGGCLPTNELMLNLKNNGWKLSEETGKHFSTNGDYAGFIDYRRTPGDHLNFNGAPFPIWSTRGPINASHVRFQDGKMLVNFEDATIPPMVAPYVRASLDVIANAANENPLLKMLKGMWKLQFEDFSEIPDLREPDHYMTEHQLLQNTFFFNLMGSDESRGEFSLGSKNKLTLNFKGGLADDPVYQKMEEIIDAMVKAMNAKYNGPNNKPAEYFRFPFWGKGKLLDNRQTRERKFITVHPLGGCRIGADSTKGVVNEKGQVYDTSDAANPKKVHEGFYLADASVVPGPLAVNPTLTIVAFARKIAAGIS